MGNCGCTEAVFSQLKGVEKVDAGYSGGKTENPSYEDVCSGETGHAEVVQITFNKKVITYKQLLEIFFTTHDPTTLNRQGADIGSQYRSIILYHDLKQKNTAEKVLHDFDKRGIWDKPIVTEIMPVKAFYRAEEYHQNYYQKNPGKGYCRFVIAPKVAKFREKYGKFLKPEV